MSRKGQSKATPKLHLTPVEASWAAENIQRAETFMKGGDWAFAAQQLDVARLHLERIALEEGQKLHARTESAQAMEERHTKIRGTF